MERQRSLSIKPTRFLVFSFIITSSLLLCFFYWFYQNYASHIPAETHLLFDKTSLSFDLKTHVSLNKTSPRFNLKFKKAHIFTTLAKNITRNETNNTTPTDTHFKKLTAAVVEKSEKKNRVQCDVYDGRWVFDENYPMYDSVSCPYIDEGFNCEANGRPNKDYMKWRWEPHNCKIPRFNGRNMLELIRGKRLVFVGDSINRNQWESMLCLLRGAVKDPKRVFEAKGRRITKEKGNYSFKFVDYHCSVEFYVTHFLVHETKARVEKKRVPTLRIDTIDRSSSKWKGADILVFNTAHWWTHFKTKSGINYYQEGDQVHRHLDVSSALRRALTTWASWVDQHAIPGKTQVFFRSSAPSHFRGGRWDSGGHCRDTQPLQNDTSSGYYTEKNRIVEQVIRTMKTPVTLLNITSLSELRVDGHPSVYGSKRRKDLARNVQDCSHWCLPGIPDTWNTLLYFLLFSIQKVVS